MSDLSIENRSATDEESWYALWQRSRNLRDSGSEQEFVATALEAFRIRPHRAEPLHDLARYYLGKSRGDISILYSDAGMWLPVPIEDRLGVEKDIYLTGLKEAFVIAASYSIHPAEKDRGRAICNWLSLCRDTPEWVRGLARHNYNWYAEPAQLLVPSIKFNSVSIKAPDGFVPGNISIAREGDNFVILIRAVNYDLLESGYFDRHGDTSFRQRTILARLDEHLRIISSTEVLAPEDLPPPEHTDSVGFEDPRPIIWRGDLWCISSIRQLNSDGRAEMVLAQIGQTARGDKILTNWRVLASAAPMQWEKNWMPQVVGDQLRFIYSVDPTRVITDSADVISEDSPSIAVENFRGGSQAIPFDGGWLAVVHEWQVVRRRRHYFHRFIWLDENNQLRRLSKRFYFLRIASEFVAGLALHVTGDRLVVSFGIDDHEPTLAVVDLAEIRAALLDIALHRAAYERACEAGCLAWRQLKDQCAGHPAGDRDGVASLGGQNKAIVADKEFARETKEITSIKDLASVRECWYIVSHLGTILYFDESSRKLQHSYFGTANLNLHIELESAGHIRSASGIFSSDAERLFLSQGEDAIIVLTSRGDTNYDIEMLPDDMISIRIGSQYMSADLDGVVRCDRNWRREWEQFRLARTDTLDAMALLRDHCWLSHDDRRIVSLANEPIALAKKREDEPSRIEGTSGEGVFDLHQELLFGPARLKPLGKAQSVIIEGTSDSKHIPPARMNVVGSSGATYGFSRFNPLIYYCVYGNESFYDCLRLSLESLDKYGRYDGAIGVACDKTASEAMGFIPKCFHNRLILSNASKDRGWFNQYYIENDIYDEFQPILYTDVDIIFDCDVLNILIDILLQQKVCVATESKALAHLSALSPRDWPEYPGSFFGRYLYAKEPWFPDKAAFGNAGQVGFDTIYRFRTVNQLVRAIASRQTSERLRIFGDQPILNYVLRKTGLGNFELMDRYSRLTRNIEDVPPASRRGVAHFHLASGMEDGTAKYSIMTSYIERLSEDETRAKMDRSGVELNLSIPGQLAKDELEQLARLARLVPPNGCIVEIGSLFGLSSWTLARNSHPTVTIYCIDPWVREPWMAQVEASAGQTLSLETFRKNVEGCQNIIPLPGYSPRDFIGWQRPVDLVFEDSVHANPTLRATLAFWSRFVRASGTISGHDYCDQFPDVRSEADQLAIAFATKVEVVGTLWSVSAPPKR